MFKVLSRLFAGRAASEDEEDIAGPAEPSAQPQDGVDDVMSEAAIGPEAPEEPQLVGEAEILPFSSADSRYHRIHPHTMALVEEMKSYAGFVEIMQRHLTNVCGDTQSAAENILGQVLHIEGSVSGLVRHVGDSMQSDELLDATDTLKLSVETGQSAIAQLIREHEETQAELCESLRLVSALSKQMRSRLDEIESVRRYTDLLAINARIRIASLGKNTGLEVIAEEIRNLATQTGQLAQDLNGELGQMDQLVNEELMAKVANQQRTDNARADDLQRSFTALARHMELLTQFQADLIREVQDRGEAMRDPLNTLCGSIQFQDVARQQLEQVSGALSMISDHFVSLSNAIIHEDAPPDSSIATCLASILENYVMEQQRAVHRGASAAAAPKIELF